MLGVVLACALLLTSCEPQLSLRSLYTSDEVVFESKFDRKLGDEPNRIRFIRVHADGFCEGRGRRLCDHVYDTRTVQRHNWRKFLSMLIW